MLSFMPGVLYQAGAPGPSVLSSLPLLLPLQRRAPWISAVWYHFTSSAAQGQLSPLQLYWLQGSAAQLTQGHHVPEKCIHGGLPESLSLEMGQVRHPGGRQQRKQAGVCSQACVTLKCSCCEPLRLLAAGCSAGCWGMCVCAPGLWASAAAPAGFYGSQICCGSYSLTQTFSVIETQTMSKSLFSQLIC